jgi:hypothetical protein
MVDIKNNFFLIYTLKRKLFMKIIKNFKNFIVNENSQIIENMKSLNQKSKEEIFDGNNWSEEKISIYRDRESNQVVFFRKLETFTVEFIRLYINGNIWGVYYKDNELVAEDIWGEIHNNIEE